MSFCSTGAEKEGEKAEWEQNVNTEPCKIKERDKQRAGRAKYAPAFPKSWFQEREREREREAREHKQELAC